MKTAARWQSPRDAPAKSADQGLQICADGAWQDFAVAAGALRDAETQVCRDQRLHAIEEEIVKLGTGLAADLDGVFEAGGRNQSHARALALQQGVRADGGAVQKDHASAGRSCPGLR